MKNTIIVLILLLLSVPSLAQDDAVKQSSLNDNNVVYPQLRSLLRSEKNRYRLLFSNNNQSDSKCFIGLYNKLNLVHKGGKTKRVTFMDGPVIFSLAPAVEINRSSVTLYQKYSSIDTEPSGALKALGVVSGIAAGVFFPSYTRGISLSGSKTSEDAYLESISRQKN